MENPADKNAETTRNLEIEKLTSRRNLSLYNSHKRNFTFYNKMTETN